MPLIDPNKALEGPTRRLEGEKNPAFRRMLEEVRYHGAVEAAYDIDKALDRLSPEAEYVLYRDGQPPEVLSGVAVIRQKFYLDMFEVCSKDLEWDVVRCVVDEGVVITEGLLKAAVRGDWLAKQGFDVDPEAFYLRRGRHMVVWPFDSQLRPIGETVYYGPLDPLSEVVKHKLNPGDIGKFTGEIILPHS